jgi:hypothetical protein
MAKSEDRQAKALQYLQLLQSGVPAAEAFKQVYPNGIPTQQQQAEKDAKAKQSGQLVATAGTVGGLLAAKYGAAALEAGLASSGTAAAGTSAAAGGATTAAAGSAAGAGAASTAGTSAATTGASTTGSASASGSLGLSGGAALGLTALGTYLAGKSAYDQYRGKEDNSNQGKAGRAQLAWTTGGISEIARALGIGGQPSTRDIAKKNTQSLFKVSEDPTYRNYVAGMREQYLKGPADPSKPFAGKYANFEEYKNAGLDAKDLTGVYGNLKTFGPEWSKLSQDQRESVTQGLIGANLYDSKKGEVVINDALKAQEIYANIMKQQPAQRPQVAQQPAPAQVQAPAISAALAKKQQAQNAEFQNQLLQQMNKRQ